MGDFARYLKAPNFLGIADGGLMRSLLDLWHGIVSQPRKLGTHIFASFSMAFTVVKAIVHFFPTLTIDGWAPLSLILLGSTIYGLRKVWKPSRVEIPVANCNTVIEVLFGDLFEQDGIRGIAVNEFFDSKLGKPVSPKSVHGLFLQKCFGGHPESFDAQLAIELAGTPGTAVRKVEGKQLCYPIGTTALITVNTDRYIAFAFAKTEPDTCKAYSDVELMWHALHDFWARARNESGGYPVNLPLVGGGLSGLGLPTRDLVNLILLSAIAETKAREITQTIRVILNKSRFKDIDLRDVREHWEE
jgi:hypothetical protein